MRLIDADALMKVIREHDYPLRDRFNSTDNGMFTIGVQQAVDEAPTIDAVPVVRGEWEDIPNRYVCVAGDRPYHGNATSCSVCHDINPNAFKTNFCPNCGADMRGSEVKE